jgi:hypothetical protein
METIDHVSHPSRAAPSFPPSLPSASIRCDGGGCVSSNWDKQPLGVVSGDDRARNGARLCGDRPAITSFPALRAREG